MPQFPLQQQLREGNMSGENCWKTAIVTGGSRGIGCGIALSLAALGRTLLLPL